MTQITKTAAIIIAFVFFFSSKETLAQICNGLHPNKQTTLQANNVKTVTRWQLDHKTGNKRINSIHYLDSTGCARRYIYYDRRWKQYKVKEEKGNYSTGKTEFYSGYFNADSIEVMNSRDIYFYESGNWIVKEEHFFGGATLRHQIIYHKDRNPNLDRETYTLNEQGDTLSFEHWIQNKHKTATFRKEQQDDKWKVTKNDSTIRQRNEKGDVVLEKYYEHGHLIGGKKIDFAKDLIKEFDIEGNLIREIEGDERETTTREYKDGKLIKTETMRFPVADPMDEEIFIIDKELIDPSQFLPKDTLKQKNNKLLLPKTNVKEQKQDTVIVHYQNPKTKTEIKSKEIFSSTGLILEIQWLFKNQTETFEYEYLIR